MWSTLLVAAVLGASMEATGVTAAPPCVERAGVKATGLVPGKAETGHLGFTFETGWLEGRLVLRCPETLSSSMGMHFIDHRRADMPQLSELSDQTVWESDPDRGVLSYRARTQEGVLFEGTAEPTPGGAWITFRVHNGTQETLLNVSNQMCLDLSNAEGLNKRHELGRTFTWVGGKRCTLDTMTPASIEKGPGPWLFIPTKALRGNYKGPMKHADGWQVVEQTADHALLARASADGAGIAAIAWDEAAAMLMTNTNIPCLHAGPNTSRDLPPGADAVWRGKVYLTTCSPDQLLAQFTIDRAEHFVRHDLVVSRDESPGAQRTGSSSIRAAAVRVVWNHGQEPPAAIVERGFQLAEEAVAQGAELVVFPENFLHSEDPAEQLIPEGALVRRAEAFARKHQVYLCAGIIESWKFDWRDAYDTYLSAILVGPEGYLSKHRKVDVDMVAYDRTWAPGMPKTDMGVWSGEDFAMHKAGPVDRLAVMICRDTDKSWAWTRVLTQNPQIIASPNLRDSVTKYGADFGAMAAKSGVPVVVACGHPASESFIINRRGEVVAFLNEKEGVIVADVELAPEDPSLISIDVVHNTFVVIPEY